MVVKNTSDVVTLIRELHTLLGQVYEVASKIDRRELAVLYRGVEDGESQATKAIVTATLTAEICGSLLEHDFVALGID